MTLLACTQTIDRFRSRKAKSFVDSASRVVDEGSRGVERTAYPPDPRSRVPVFSPGLLVGNPPPRWGAPGDDLVGCSNAAPAGESLSLLQQPASGAARRSRRGFRRKRDLSTAEKGASRFVLAMDSTR